MMKVSSLFLVFALFGKASAEGSCACEAEELGFAIDCSQTAAMLESLDFLNTNACATACSSDDCVKHYYIVQSHHDFCPESDIPEAVEDGFHDFDEQCKGCKISRGVVEGAPNCPVANCEDTSGNDAYVSLVENACNIDCSSDTCRNLFFTLRIVHDTCPHDTLSGTSEKGLHDMERPCADQICNDPSGGAGQLVCDPHAGHSGPFEWAGVFAVSDVMHMWSMQAIDGKYPDETMRLVFFPTEGSDIEAIHSTEEAGERLIEGDSCVVVEDGETMEPIAATGSCFELHVGKTDDSKYMINTAGVTGIVVYAQHVPIEFERDMHYLRDSTGADIEPIVEEGAGDHEHDHSDSDDHDGDHSGAAIFSTATGVVAVIGSILLV